jgi:Tfp pilus assembly protein PilO
VAIEEKRSSIGLITTIKEGKDKTNSYITLSFTLLVIALLVMFAIRPTITTITKINKDIKEKERINTMLARRIKTLASLDDEYERSKEKFETLSFTFPVVERHILLLSNIDQIVSRNGFKLNSVSLDNYEGEKYNLSPSVLKPSLIQLSVTGQYNSFINLLKDLESLPMFAVMENVSFSNVKDEKGGQSFSISMRVYSIRENNFYKQK